MSINLTHRYYLGRDPFKDWAAIFIASCLLAIVLAVIGIGQYGTVNESLTAASSATASSTLPFTEKSLDAAAGILDVKAANRKSIMANPVPVGDPSQ